MLFLRKFISKKLKINQILMKLIRFKSLKNFNNLRFLKNYFHLIFNRILLYFIDKKCNNYINFVAENANWSIKWDGLYLKKTINKKYNNSLFNLTSIPQINSQKKVIHFGSQYMWVDWWKLLPNKNKYVVSFFHGKYEDGSGTKKHIDEFIKSEESLYKIITGSTLIRERLSNWGIPESKLICIPIGVDTNLFTIPDIQKKEKIRKTLGFKKNEIIIGSFQKDGIGWSDGLEPKYIKGPDLLVESLNLVSKELPIKVLLTGPARGYVKNELFKKNIKFKHIYLESYEEIVNYYHALDLYLVSSREEGGPKAIVESMASGVPIVTTNVGMAQDFVVDQVNGGLVNSFDPNEIAKKIIEIISNPKKENLIKHAREDVMRADWEIVSQIHWDKVYKPALSELNENINF